MPVVIFSACLDLEQKSSLINRLINNPYVSQVEVAADARSRNNAL
jgi:hypothetical protein